MAPVLCRNKLEICSRITKIFCACKFSVVGRLGFLGKACNSSRCVPALKETSLYSKFTLKYAAIATSPLFPVYPEICRNFYLFPISSLHRNMPQLLPLPYFQFTPKYAAIATSPHFQFIPKYAAIAISPLFPVYHSHQSSFSHCVTHAVEKAWLD